MQRLGRGGGGGGEDRGTGPGREQMEVGFANQLDKRPVPGRGRLQLPVQRSAQRC